MKKINMIYWDSDNFGDALNPVLVEELSGLKTQFKDTSLSRKERLSIILKTLYRFESRRLRSIVFPWQKTVTAIGSILSFATKGSFVWGSGFMNTSDGFRGGQTLAVRGRLTDKKLQELGHLGCSIYGDPALLLPLWIKPATESKYQLGLIPHWKEVEYFKKTYGDRYFIIDLRTRDIQKVVDEITSCKHILSTSLHGVIVGQAYNIPSLWIKHGYIDTDGFKFHDYFSSVDIPLYEEFKNLPDILKNEESWKSLFLQHQDKSKINNSLKQIQVGLLKVAPFPLKDKYKRFCTE